MIRFAIAALTMLATLPAMAEHLPCFPYPGAMQTLMQDMGEAPAFVGVTGSGELFVVSVGEDGKWSIGATDGKKYCMVSGGSGWQEAPDALKRKALEPMGDPS